MSLIERIEMLCDQKGITIYRLEKDLGMARNTIRKWDTVSPRSKTLRLVADFFDVSLDYLIGRTTCELAHKETISPSGVKVLKKVEELRLTESEANFIVDVITTIIKGHRNL